MIVDRLPDREQPWDLCIIGSGPVGMSMALEFDSLGHDVLLLEAGSLEPNPAGCEDSRAEIADAQRHAPMEIATCRAFGGTSWMWGGRIVPFDDIDFEFRDWVPDSNWPIAHADIHPWYAGACEYLLCGNDTFKRAPQVVPSEAEGTRFDCLERWATESRIILAHRHRIATSQRITLAINSTVVDFEFDSNLCQTESIVVSMPERRTKIHARRIILALGGVETTRLLLSVQRLRPSLFGGAEGPLGRYYMGHIFGEIANLVFNEPRSISDFDFMRDESGTYIRRRFALTAVAQRQHRVMNTAFFVDNPPFYDHRHRNGVLSAVFLALAFPPTGRRILPEGIRLAHIGVPPRHYGAHLWNAILGAPAGVCDIVNILRFRVFGKPRKPGFLLQNSAGKYALRYHAEQEPNPESRITLGGEADRFGLPRARIDLRYTDNDVASVVKSHRVLDQGLRAAGLGRLNFWLPEQELASHVCAQATDGYHQTGTTRMGADPRTSVVDCNLRIHGLENMYVASSSVFRTTGQANSTLPAVALGLRLVHHLHQETGRQATSDLAAYQLETR